MLRILEERHFIIGQAVLMELQLKLIVVVAHLSNMSGNCRRRLRRRLPKRKITI